MYFSISQIKNDRAAQLAVMAANQLGEQMLAGYESSVAFESTIASISRKTGHNTALVAAQLLSQEVDYRKRAISVGLNELTRVLGGEKNVQQFFKQVTYPKAKIRFDSVGGMRSDIHAAKNRAAMLAMRAANDRIRQPKVVDYLPTEREFVDFVKSVSRTLEAEVESGNLDVETARDVSLQIEEAAYTDLNPQKKGRVVVLQAEASKEVFQEARSRIIARYQNRIDGPDKGPRLH